MSALLEKLKKSRETHVEAGGFTFTVRRPTDLEVVEMRGKPLTQGDIMARYVTGWSGVREMDIIPGGDGVAVPFETALFLDWAADQPDLWAPLTEAILKAYDDPQKRQDDALKKPEPG